MPSIAECHARSCLEFQIIECVFRCVIMAGLENLRDGFNFPFLRPTQTICLKFMRKQKKLHRENFHTLMFWKYFACY